MDNTILLLKTGTTVLHEGGRTGLMFDGAAKFASNAFHEALIEDLGKGGRTLAEITRDAARYDNWNGNEAETALAIASFILEFEDYLEG